MILMIAAVVVVVVVVVLIIIDRYGLLFFPINDFFISSLRRLSLTEFLPSFPFVGHYFQVRTRFDPSFVVPDHLFTGFT